MRLAVDNIETTFALYKRRVRCPRHYLLKPGAEPFVMERIPSLKNIKEADAKIFGLKLWRRKKDKNGVPIQNFKSYFQPEVSAGWLKQNIYLKDNPICLQCKRCVIK